LERRKETERVPSEEPQVPSGWQRRRRHMMMSVKRKEDEDPNPAHKRQHANSKVSLYPYLLISPKTVTKSRGSAVVDHAHLAYI